MANWISSRFTNLLLRGSPGQTQEFCKAQDSNKVEKYAFDVNGHMRQSGIVSITRKIAKVSVSSTSILSMYTTGVQILAAPAAGVALVPLQILFEMTTTATQYANGGVVVFQYDNTAHGAGVAVHAGSIPAAVVTAAAATTVTGLWNASGANGLTIPTAKGIFISNQTALFITGTGTAIVKITYDEVTVG